MNGTHTMHLANPSIRRPFHALLVVAALLLSGAISSVCAQNPAIVIAPPAASMEVGQTLTISVQIDTAGQGVRGGAVVLVFDPNVFQVAGGAGGIQLDASSVYQLTPPPVVAAGQVQIPFLAPSFEQVPYVGGIAFVQFLAVGPSQGTTISLAPNISRFSPVNGTPMLGAGQYVVIGDPTPTEEAPENQPTPVNNPSNDDDHGVNGGIITVAPTGGDRDPDGGSSHRANASNDPGHSASGAVAAPSSKTERPATQAGTKPAGAKPAENKDPSAEKPGKASEVPVTSPVAPTESMSTEPTAAETQIASLPSDALPGTPDMLSEFERRWSPGLVRRLGGKFNWHIYE